MSAVSAGFAFITATASEGGTTGSYWLAVSRLFVPVAANVPIVTIRKTA